MAGMFMVMSAVVPRVVMVVRPGSPAMGVFVKMFMRVLVCMSVSVLMAVHRAVVGMFVGVCMSVIVLVQMFVFVLSFHN